MNAGRRKENYRFERTNVLQDLRTPYRRLHLFPLPAGDQAGTGETPCFAGEVRWTVDA